MNIVYCVTNKISGKKYISITKQPLADRKKGHRHKAKTNNKHPFYDAWRYYGEDNFEWKILQECETIQEAAELEIRFIAEMNTISPNGYNILPGGIVPPNMKGIPKSEKHKKNKRIAHR